MKAIILGAFCCLLAFEPALARSGHHRHHRHVSRSHGAGTPITAQSDSIRINSVGEVISQPTPLIQKERNFDNRARGQLSGKPVPDAPGKGSVQQ